ncbi:MAG: RHS repeat-associated core domain-containing protein [Bacteroidota bacterium]
MLEIVEEKNYYPFGLQHKGYNSQVTGTHYPYGFGGKEYQEELDLNWHDFGARNYDPALGRWMNLDPLAEDMRRHSPYNYAFNNPAYYIDPDGMMPFGHGGIDDHNNFDDRVNDWQPRIKGYYADNYTGEIHHFPGYNGNLPGFTFLGDDDATVGEIQDAYKKFKEAKKFLETMKFTVIVIDALDGGAGQTTKKLTKKVLLKKAARLLQEFNTRVYKALKNIPAGWKVKKADGNGIIIYNPKQPRQRVRIMQADPNSPYPTQRVPYVIDQSRTSGQFIDVNRKPVLGLKPNESPDAHIPLSEWKGFN